MFSTEEILEEFVEAAHLGADYFSHDVVDALEGAALPSALKLGLDPKDPATRFLEASEEERAVIRAEPRVIKKQQEENSVASRTRPAELVELTLADAEAIRKASRNTAQRELARRYGVSVRTIGRIVHGQTYRPETGREFKIHTWEYAKIYERWKNGETINAIARERGVGRKAIKRILTKYAPVCTDARKRPEERSREIALLTDSRGEPGRDHACVDARIGQVR